MWFVYLRNAVLIALGLAILWFGADMPEHVSDAFIGFHRLCVIVTALTIPSVIYKIWFEQTDRQLRLPGWD